MTDPRSHLRALADALPPGTSVPVPRVLEVLGTPNGGESRSDKRLLHLLDAASARSTWTAA